MHVWIICSISTVYLISLSCQSWLMTKKDDDGSPMMTTDHLLPLTNICQVCHVNKYTGKVQFEGNIRLSLARDSSSDCCCDSRYNFCLVFSWSKCWAKTTKAISLSSAGDFKERREIWNASHSGICFCNSVFSQHHTPFFPDRLTLHFSIGVSPTLLSRVLNSSRLSLFLSSESLKVA